MTFRGDTTTPIEDGNWDVRWAETPGQVMIQIRQMFTQGCAFVEQDGFEYLRCEVIVDAGFVCLVWALITNVVLPSGGVRAVWILPWAEFTGGGGGTPDQSLPIDFFLSSPGWNGHAYTRQARDGSGVRSPTITQTWWETLVPAAKGAMLAAMAQPGFTTPLASVYRGTGPTSMLTNLLSLQCYADLVRVQHAFERLAFKGDDSAAYPSEYLFGTDLDQGVGSDNGCLAVLVDKLSTIATAVEHIANSDMDISINNGQTIFSVRGRTITS